MASPFSDPDRFLEGFIHVRHVVDEMCGVIAIVILSRRKERPSFESSRREIGRMKGRRTQDEEVKVALPATLLQPILQPLLSCGRTRASGATQSETSRPQRLHMLDPDLRASLWSQRGLTFVVRSNIEAR